MSSYLFAGLNRGQADTGPDAVNELAGTFQPVVDAGAVVTDLATVATQGTTTATAQAAMVTQYGSIQTSLNTLISTIGSGTGSVQAQALLALVNTGSTDLAAVGTDITTLQTDITAAQTAANVVTADLGNLSDITLLMNLGKALNRIDVTEGENAIARWLEDGRSLLNYYLPI